ncbi:right-handed parallel beta-helix repeat-containing protein [Methanohalophilus mahii]|uniref:Periplasmic copper-binding protein n=1 Tax=Methanohalophilus mahii (strain ATCC 35705 / DSM 5219 / SLP) TaxID=547558 RepID=D5E924_METMS|nr:NosD domain-containing protein [Methanohalophilus mahii]ADE35675.1 periplasmic copper-binding protein [Methanohalophilus mahii DSM 5219]
MRENVDSHRFWILLASSVVLVLLSSVSLAAEITVDDDGTEDYTTIQAAVNAAVDDDTILVYPGTYSENVDVGKELNITSVGGVSVTHVYADNTDKDVFHITADSVTINGFNMSRATGTSCSGIRIEGNHSTIINNIVSNNKLGITLFISDNNNITGNTASGNNYAGIYLQLSDNNDLNDNIVSENNQYGIYLASAGGISRSNNFINNTVSKNNKGIFLQSPQDSTLTDNTVFNNTNDGITLDSFGDLFYVENNTLIGNTVLNNKNGIYIKKINGNALIGNIALDNNNGIKIDYSYYNNLTQNNISNNTDNGVHFVSSHENRLVNNTILNNKIGLRLGGYYGSSNNFVGNNYFNNSNNAYFDADSDNHWNTTKTTGPNIIGGPYIGGNFWAKSDGSGWSQEKADNDGDGFCDSIYELSDGNIDYLPLAGDSTGPSVVPISPMEQTVGPGELLELNVSVTDDSEISSVVVNVSSVNDTINEAVLSNVNGYWVNNSITLDVNPHGMYNLSINATDEFGNSNTSMNLSVIGESTTPGDGNEEDGGNFVYHPQPLFDVPTGNPLLLVGVLGLVVMFFVRRRE